MKWCTRCRAGRDDKHEQCPWCGERLLPEKPTWDTGYVMVYGSSNPVAASLLLARLGELDLPGQVINRPDIYWGGSGVWFPDTFQVLMREDLADKHKSEIAAAIRDVEDELAEQDTGPV